MTETLEARRPAVPCRVTRTVVLAACALGFGLAAAAPDSTEVGVARVDLGGVSMQRACETQYRGLGLTAHVQDPGDPYSWECRSPWGYRCGIDVNRACADQYGGGTYSTVLDQRNAYSWRCVR